MQRGRAVAVIVFVAACGAGQNTPAKSSCTADTVLRNIGTAIVTGEESLISESALKAADLIATCDDNVETHTMMQVQFDSTIVRDVLSSVRILHQRYRGFRINSVEPGSIHDHVQVEGMDIFVKQMTNSRIVLEKDGREVVLVVENLVAVGDCWKVSHLGPGADRPPAHMPAAESQKRRPREGDGFRPFAGDFCTGLGIYASDGYETKIGVLVEGYRAYTDPVSGRVYEAVLLRSLSTGHVRGVWMNLEQLAATYVDRSDHALQDCAWNINDQAVQPVAGEIPADVPRPRTSEP